MRQMYMYGMVYRYLCTMYDIRAKTLNISDSDWHLSVLGGPHAAAAIRVSSMFMYM